MGETIKFLELIRNSAMLYFIISNGSIPENLSNDNKINFWSRTSFDIENIELGNEVFRTVNVLENDSFVLVEFTTTNLNYFNTPDFFFNRNGIKRAKRDYQINNEIINQQFIELGVFHVPNLKYPISVELKKRNSDCIIAITILSKELREKDLALPIYSFNGNLTSPEILGLFNPEEITLKHTYKPDSYSITIDIVVNQINKHPLVKYFEQKGEIFYKDKFFEHNLIPSIPLYEYCNLRLKKSNEVNSFPILYLEDCRRLESLNSVTNEAFSNVSITYKSIFPEIRFMNINGENFTSEEISRLDIDLGKSYELTEISFGKDAIDRFGKYEYYQGIGIYKHKYQ